MTTAEKVSAAEELLREIVALDQWLNEVGLDSDGNALSERGATEFLRLENLEHKYFEQVGLDWWTVQFRRNLALAEKALPDQEG